MALLRSLILRILLAVALLAGAAAVPAAAPGEYEVKAAFLFNFSQFVDWPPPAFENAASPLIIGVLGHDPFGPGLDEIVRGETVKGRPLVVRRYERIDDVGPCHILFIDRSQRSRLGEILAKLRGRSILTVGDFDDFALKGGVIRFVTVGNRIRMDINLQAARDADLTISSKLLRPARIVAADDR